MKYTIISGKSKVKQHDITELQRDWLLEQKLIEECSECSKANSNSSYHPANFVENELDNLIEKLKEFKPGLSDNEKDEFGTLSKTILNKVQTSFGKTIQHVEVSDVDQDDEFFGEEVSQEMEIISNGVVYRVVVSAEKAKAWQ